MKNKNYLLCLQVTFLKSLIFCKMKGAIQSVPTVHKI